MDHPVPATAGVLRGRLPLFLLVAAAILPPAVFWQGGVLEEETIVFLRNYWGDRGLLQRVFDPHANDFGTYQARELSYFFDSLDAQVLRALLRRGVDFFVPASALVASGLVSFVFLRGVRSAMPGLPAPTAALLLLLYLSNFVFVSTMGVFYRATKPFLAPALLALLFVCWRELQNGSAGPRAAWGVLGLGVFMSLLDRQGFFFTIALAGGLALVWAFRRRGRALLAASLGAAAFGALYNFVLGPLLVHALNGYWPRFRYQRLPPSKLADPQFYLQAGELLLSHTGTLLGNLPAAGLLVLPLLVWARWRRGGRALSLALLLLAVASQIVMFALMIMRYPQVYEWADHRLWYYPLPFQALVLFGLLFLAQAAPPALTRLVLVVLIGANVAGWARNRDLMAVGPWFSKTYGQSQLFRASLRSGRPEGPLYGAYRAFFYEVRDLSPPRRAKGLPDVREGEGFYLTELRGGRVFAWARGNALLSVESAEPGPHRVEGELLLGPGDRVHVGGIMVEGPAAGEGPVRFSVTVEGKELALRAEQPERAVGSAREPKSAAFGLFFPMSVVRAGS